MDGIFNHSHSESPLTQIDHDYWYHHSPRDPDNSWGPEFNYEHYDENLEVKPAWRFIGDVVRFWIQEYHIDGIRFDAARQIANYDFMHWITEQTRQAASMKPFFNIAEHIPETASIVGLEGPMDSCWHESFRQQVLEHISGEFELEVLKEAIDGKRQGYQGATDIINYLASHDRSYIMEELGEHQILDEEAFKRVKLGAVLLITAVGVPMIWMGSEFGECQTAEEAKLDWALLGNDNNRGLFDYYKGLIELRKQHQALQTTNIDFFYEDAEAKVLAYVRWSDRGDRVVVVANFSDNFLSEYRISDFPKAGTWHEWTRNYNIEAENSLVLDLGGYEAQVFVTW